MIEEQGRVRGNGKEPLNHAQQPEIPTSATTPIGVPPRDDGKKTRPVVGALSQVQPGKLLTWAFPSLARRFNRVADLFDALGMDNQKWAYLLLGVIGLWLGGLLLGHLGHSVTRLVSRLFQPSINSPVGQNPPAVSLWNPPQAAPIQPPAGSPGASDLGPQATLDEATSRGQSLGSAGSRGGPAKGQVLSAPIPANGIGDKAQPNRAPRLEAWTQGDKPLVVEIARHFFEVSDANFEENTNYFKASMAADYFPVFTEKYFPFSRRTELSQNRLVTYFKPSSEVKLLGVTANTDTFQVQGIQTTVSRLNPRETQVLGDKPVALVVRLRHAAGFKPLADQVEETAGNGSSANNIPQGQLNGFAGTQGSSPVKASTASNVGTDALKAIGDGVNDVSHAVNTTDDAISAADKAKKLLGF